MSLYDLELEIAKQVNSQVELGLVTAIEKIEGRVPTNEEVAYFGECLMFPDGAKEWKWKGLTIIRVDPLDFSGRSSLIKVHRYT